MTMWEGKLVTIMLIVNQVLYVGGNTLCKEAMARGMSNFIFIVYSHLLAFLLLTPSALIYHRIIPFPAITFYTIARLFLLGLVRMEMLKIQSKSSILKIVGALISIVGALIMIFYQGLSIHLLQPSLSFPKSIFPAILTSSKVTNWIFGGFLLSTSSIFLSLMYIIKTWIVRDFDSDVAVTVIFIFFETNIAAMVAFFAEEGPNVWIPRTHIELIAILFGAMEVGVINVVHTWACRTKGPVFAVIFKPLQLIIAAIFGVTFLAETLHLGSIIGGVTITIGFYSVMKGKAEEEMLHMDQGNEDGNEDPESFYLRAPLLLPST